MTKRYIAKTALIVTILAISVTPLSMLVYAYFSALVMPFYDQNWFLPVVTSVHEGALEHPFFRLAGAENNLFNWHGWLTPYLYDFFLLNGRYELTLLSGIPWIFISLIMAGVIIWNRTSWLFFVILMTAYAGICFYHLGRPELVAQPFILATAYVLTSNGSILLKSLSVGVLCAIIALISPILSVMACTIAIIYFRLSDEYIEKFWQGVVCCITSFVATILVSVAANHDISIISWIDGLLTHGQNISQRANIRQISDFYLTHRYLPLLLLPLLGVLLVLCEHCIVLRDWILIVLTVFLTALITMTSIKNPLAHYNFVGILPLLMFTVMKFPPSSTKASTAYTLMLGLFALANTGSLVLRSLEYTSIEETGSVAKYKEFLQSLPHKSIVAGYTPYALIAREEGLSATGYLSINSVASAALSHPDYIIFPPQSFDGNSLPEGYCFVLKQGQDIPIRFFGFKLASHSRGWDFFALTRCANP